MARTTVKQLQETVKQLEERVQSMEAALHNAHITMLTASKHIEGLIDQADVVNIRFEGLRKWARKVNARVMRK